MDIKSYFKRVVWGYKVLTVDGMFPAGNILAIVLPIVCLFGGFQLPGDLGVTNVRELLKDKKQLVVTMTHQGSEVVHTVKTNVKSVFASFALAAVMYAILAITLVWHVVAAAFSFFAGLF